jgi:hypothetical protein
MKAAHPVITTAAARKLSSRRNLRGRIGTEAFRVGRAMALLTRSGEKIWPPHPPLFQWRRLGRFDGCLWFAMVLNFGISGISVGFQ